MTATISRIHRTKRQNLWSRTLLLDEVISHTPAGLARVGLDLHIVDANPRMGALFDTSLRILRGKPLTLYLPPEDLDAAIAK